MAGTSYHWEYIVEVDKDTAIHFKKKMDSGLKYLIKYNYDNLYITSDFHFNSTTLCIYALVQYFR